MDSDRSNRGQASPVGVGSPRNEVYPQPEDRVHTWQKALLRTRERQAASSSADRLHTYLGDWHTHPGGVAVPSRTDRTTLTRIANHAAARAPRALMLIAADANEVWRVAVWEARAKPCTLAWWRGSTLRRLRTYGTCPSFGPPRCALQGIGIGLGPTMRSAVLPHVEQTRGGTPCSRHIAAYERPRGRPACLRRSVSRVFIHPPPPARWRPVARTVSCVQATRRQQRSRRAW